MDPLKRSLGLRLLFGLVLYQLAGTATAQQPTQAQTAAVKQSCRSDYQSYCASVPTGGRASLQCLQQHQAELSTDCQAAVSAIGGGGAAAAGGAAPSGAAQVTPPAGAPPAMSKRQEVALMRRACGGDYRAYCRGVPLGGGQGIGCLAANESRLSPSCKGALAEAHGVR